MKILHTSDWHIGKSLFEFSLIEDQAFIFNQLYDIIKENQVDVVVVSGDLYDRSAPSAQAVELLDEVFSVLIQQLKVSVLAIGGNHDSAKRISYGSRLFEESGLFLEGSWQKNVRQVTLTDSYGPVNFFMLPYFLSREVRLVYNDSSIVSPTQAFHKIITELLPNIHLNERNMLIAHGFFMQFGNNFNAEEVSYGASSEGSSEVSFIVNSGCSGSELSVGTSDLTDLSPAAIFDYVALGHLHSPQSAGSETMRYSGSLMKYSISEAKISKSFTLLDWKEKGSLNIQQIPLKPKRDLRVLRGTLAQLLDKSNQQGFSLEDFIFANIISSDPIHHAMGQLRGVFPNALGLTFTSSAHVLDELTPQYDLTSLTVDQLFDQFYTEVMGEDLAIERKNILLETIEALHQEDNVQ